jgi:hypothetical protein
VFPFAPATGTVLKPEERTRSEPIVICMKAGKELRPDDLWGQPALYDIDSQVLVPASDKKSTSAGQ